MDLATRPLPSAGHVVSGEDHEAVDVLYTSYTMVSSGILWNIPRVTCIFQYTHEPLGECVYKENTSDEWDIHSMPRETIV